MINKWLREPFFHFIIIGALLFTLYEFAAGKSSYESEELIHISSDTLDSLREQWRKQNGSEPDQAVLEELAESVIYQEVLLREARRLGLDSNDTIVRRRLVQKMEFLAANLAQMQTPNEETLAAYYDTNYKRYEIAERRSLTHIYFSQEKRGANLLDDATNLLSELQQEGATQHVANKGDNFILQYHYSDRTQQQLAQIFGNEFAERVFQLDIQQWQGPIVSEYGAHLVFVGKSNAAYLPGFKEVRSKVLNDVMQAQLDELKDKSYQTMRERYQIELELE